MSSTEATVWHRPETDADGYLPEGPRECGDRIVWVNIQTGPDATAGDVHVRQRDGSHRAVRLPGRPGFVFPTTRPNTLFVGCEKSVGWLDLDSGTFTSLATIPDTNPRTIINDGEVVPGGRAVVFGTKDVRFADPITHLYLFTPDDNRLTVLAGGQTCSNGKVFAAGGATLYDIDTPRKVVTKYRFDLASRTVVEAGIALDLRPRDDFPDGMCACGDGRGDGTVIVAFYNPNVVPVGRAVRYRLGTGEVLDEWLTPGSPRVTCPLLVNRPDGVKLILTTAVEGMPADQRASCPNAGCLFVADTSLTSVPAAAVVVG